LKLANLLQKKDPFIPPLYDGIQPPVLELLLLPNNQIFLYTYVPKYKSKDVVDKHLIWDKEKDKIVETKWQFPAALSFDGRFLVWKIGTETLATVFDLTTGEEIAKFPRGSDIPQNYAFSYDNRYIAYINDIRNFYLGLMVKSVSLLYAPRNVKSIFLRFFSRW
jgi:hypothetical protein